MKLGIEVGSHTLDMAIELGIFGVPIQADQLAKDGLQATLAPLKDRGLSVCQIAAFGFNPLALDPSQYEVLQAVIPIAADTGCPYIVINGGNYHPSGFLAADLRNFTDEALDEVARVLAPLARQAEKYGAKLAIEAYLKTAVSTPERFLTLFEKVGSDALVVNIDVTSLYGFWELVDPTNSVQHTCTTLAGHYGLGHLKEIGLTDGFHLQAGLVPIGSGSTNWGQVLSLMSPHLPQDSWIIIEHISSPEEARSSVALIKQTAVTVGVTLE